MSRIKDTATVTLNANGAKAKQIMTELEAKIKDSKELALFGVEGIKLDVRASLVLPVDRQCVLECRCHSALCGSARFSAVVFWRRVLV